MTCFTDYAGCGKISTLTLTQKQCLTCLNMIMWWSGSQIIIILFSNSFTCCHNSWFFFVFIFSQVWQHALCCFTAWPRSSNRSPDKDVAAWIPLCVFHSSVPRLKNLWVNAWECIVLLQSAQMPSVWRYMQIISTKTAWTILAGLEMQHILLRECTVLNTQCDMLSVTTENHLNFTLSWENKSLCLH